jgi:predicted alpha-1,2-mannosidase
LPLLLTLAPARPAQAQVEYVDPTIGGVGFLLEPTRPTVQLPHSPVRVYPVRKDWLDDRIESFPLTIISHRMGELFWLMPHDGQPAASAWTTPVAYDQETVTPYYYSTRLDDSLIQIEFTPGERSGYFRFTVPSQRPTVLLANRLSGTLETRGDAVVTGSESFKGMKAYFHGELSAPVDFVATAAGGRQRVAATVKQARRTLELRYGISFISVEQAARNLHQEIPSWGFEAFKKQARKRWNEVLGQVAIQGGTPAQRRVFYTALYRAHERMVNISEGGKYYSAFDHKVHEDARPFYVDSWLWDSFRAHEPLLTLLDPAMQADKLQSYVRMYEQSGWMPSFAVLWGEHDCMTGNHAAAWMADAWFKGIRDFDLERAYAGLRKNSLEGTLLPWRSGPKTKLDDFYAERGFLPALRPDEKETVDRVHPFERRQSVAVTLEHSYDDWCTAQLARVLGKQPDYQLFLERAGFYRNVYRADKGFMWPKDGAGKWIEPFDPAFSGGMGARAYFTENNAYTYNWDVQHDLQGLFELMGGRAQAEQKLDQLFREELGRSKYKFWAVLPDSSGMVGQFSMGNEPSFHIPYLYNHLGAPWKTQKRIRMLLEAWFNDTIHGIPGDEDGGGMSAFVVFSMLGFYPVVPGVPTYDVGSPVFDRAVIRLPHGKTLTITAKNNSKNNKYIQRIRLNGEPLERMWFRHADVAQGGTLELQMGATPNRTLGAQPAVLPPSAMSVDPRAFVPASRRGAGLP